MWKSGLKTKQFLSASEEDTWNIAKDLIDTLPRNGCLLLEGDLGAGKTQFSKGLIHALTGTPLAEIRSPTFTYLRSYTGRNARVHHFDLYRVSDPTMLEELGILEEIEDEKAYRVIEWPDRAAELLPAEHTLCRITCLDNSSTRTITITRSVRS
jgi:tRNA threonylcarbamoyl adenosine modification protein YjeE